MATRTIAPGGSAAPFEFAGEQRDASTGLDYLRARYYDPDTGRLITKDPRGGSAMMPGTMNGYPSVLGNSVSGVDPSGLCKWGLPCLRPVKVVAERAVEICDSLTGQAERGRDLGGVLWDGFGPPYTWEKLIQMADLVPVGEICTAVSGGAAAAPCNSIETQLDNAAYAAFLRQIFDSNCSAERKAQAIDVANANRAQGIVHFPGEELVEVLEYLGGNALLDCSSELPHYEGVFN